MTLPGGVIPCQVTGNPAPQFSSFDQTSVDPADIAVATSGDSFTHVDFGEVRNRADISGRVYEDLNADGIEDAAEDDGSAETDKTEGKPRQRSDDDDQFVA